MVSPTATSHPPMVWRSLRQATALGCTGTVGRGRAMTDTRLRWRRATVGPPAARTRKTSGHYRFCRQRLTDRRSRVRRVRLKDCLAAAAAATTVTTMPSIMSLMVRLVRMRVLSMANLRTSHRQRREETTEAFTRCRPPCRRTTRRTRSTATRAATLTRTTSTRRQSLGTPTRGHCPSLPTRMEVMVCLMVILVRPLASSHLLQQIMINTGIFFVIFSLKKTALPLAPN